jgi:hypothetical protein
MTNNAAHAFSLELEDVSSVPVSPQYRRMKTFAQPAKSPAGEDETNDASRASFNSYKE